MPAKRPLRNRVAPSPATTAGNRRRKASPRGMPAKRPLKDQAAPSPPDTTASNRSRMASAIRLVGRAMQVGYRGWLAFLQLTVALRAIVVRVVFAGLSLALIFLVVYIKEEPFYWILGVFLFPLLWELFMAARAFVDPQSYSRRLEKWFSLCIFTYLLCTCPPIWILELHLAHKCNNATELAILQMDSSFFPSLNQPWNFLIRTRRAILPLPRNIATEIWDFLWRPNIETKYLPPFPLHWDDEPRKKKTTTESPATTEMPTEEEETEEPTPPPPPPFVIPPEISSRPVAEQLKVVKKHPLYLTIRTIERVHLLCAIIGRWLLPLYGIGTDQITELLLINIGTAADIIDLFEAFNEEAVVKHFSLQVSILCLWQVSLLQFCFNKTARLEVSTTTVVEHPQTPDSGQHNPLLASATGDTNQNFNLQSCLGKKTRRSSSQSETESQVQSSSTTDIVQSSSLHETESQVQSSTIEEISTASSLQETESQTDSSDSTDGDCCCCGCFWRNYYSLRGHFVEVIFGTELWTIIMTLLLHDIPFMCLRLTLIFAFAVRSYQNVFFVVKNMVLVLAQIFRCSTLLRAYIANQQLLEQSRLLRPR